MVPSPSVSQKPPQHQELAQSSHHHYQSHRLPRARAQQSPEHHSQRHPATRGPSPRRSWQRSRGKARTPVSPTPSRPLGGMMSTTFNILSFELPSPHTTQQWRRPRRRSSSSAAEMAFSVRLPPQNRGRLPIAKRFRAGSRICRAAVQRGWAVTSISYVSHRATSAPHTAWRS